MSFSSYRALDNALSRFGFFTRTLSHTIATDMSSIRVLSTSGNPTVSLPSRVETYGGVRWTCVRVEVDIEGEESENWLDPIIGSRLMYAWDSHWNIAFAADVGGIGVGSDSTWNIHLLFGYRLELFGRDAIIRGGYRALHQNYDTGSRNSRFQWDVTQQGPIAGIALKF